MNRRNKSVCEHTKIFARTHTQLTSAHALFQDLGI